MPGMDARERVDTSSEDLMTALSLAESLAENIIMEKQQVTYCATLYFNSGIRCFTSLQDLFNFFYCLVLYKITCEIFRAQKFPYNTDD